MFIASFATWFTASLPLIHFSLLNSIDYIELRESEYITYCLTSLYQIYLGAVFIADISAVCMKTYSSKASL